MKAFLEILGGIVGVIVLVAIISLSGIMAVDDYTVIRREGD